MTKCMLWAVAGSVIVLAMTGCASRQDDGGMAVLKQDTRKPDVLAEATLKYASGLKLEVQSVSADAEFEVITPTQTDATGLELQAGNISATATDVPALAKPAAPRFWRLIRRKRISIGTTAGMVQLEVDAKDQQTSKGQWIATVRWKKGGEIQVITDDGPSEKLQSLTEQIDVYELGGGKHLVEKTGKPAEQGAKQKMPGQGGE